MESRSPGVLDRRFRESERVAKAPTPALPRKRERERAAAWWSCVWRIQTRNTLGCRCPA
jgi:hypothetical protein